MLCAFLERGTNLTGVSDKLSVYTIAGMPENIFGISVSEYRKMEHVGMKE